MIDEHRVSRDEMVVCKLHYKRIRLSGPQAGDRKVSLAALSERFGCLEGAVILGANSSKKDADGFSYWMACPREVFEFHTGQGEPFGKLHQALTKYKLEENFRMDSRLCRNDKKDSDDLPKGIFLGGWVGYFAYELGRYIEKLPETTIDDLGMPLIRLCFYDKVICYDHLKNDFWLIALQLPDDMERPEEKLAFLTHLLTRARRNSKFCHRRGGYEIDFSQIKCNMSVDFYLQMVEKIKRYIYEGDVYQVNFSQRFECDYNAKAITLFHWQNHYNPSPYAAYIDGGDFYIVSASPEMFITVIDGEIWTKPIKGTRPRVAENSKFADRGPVCSRPSVAGRNSKFLNELLYSEKEQAELNMIIDLERNDVAKICKYGSRRVIQPRTIETYPTVFHAVATIAGKLRDEITFCDILKAMFPGGSITGAPKIRSMEIIDETEPTARGVYTGSIGFIGIDGNVCLNIAIRTIIIKDQKAFVQVGGGIVADSDAHAEWAETITKARALLAGIAAVNSHRASCKLRRAKLVMRYM